MINIIFLLLSLFQRVNFLLSFPGSAGDWSQGVAHAGIVLYHGTKAPVLVSFSVIATYRLVEPRGNDNGTADNNCFISRGTQRGQDAWTLLFLLPCLLVDPILCQMKVEREFSEVPLPFSSTPSVACKWSRSFKLDVKTIATESLLMF